MTSSVRDYAILWVGAGKPGGGNAALGGQALLTTAQHKLDGIEHLAADDTTRLDASVDAHGLAPKLTGDPTDVWGGDGVFRPEAASTGGMVPTLIDTGETFTVPADRQALFTIPITIAAGGSLVVTGYLVEVH